MCGSHWLQEAQAAPPAQTRTARTAQGIPDVHWASVQWEFESDTRAKSEGGADASRLIFCYLTGKYRIL
jgi:hypothetical protein